jgi:hypothetical protein
MAPSTDSSAPTLLVEAQVPEVFARDSVASILQKAVEQDSPVETVTDNNTKATGLHFPDESDSKSKPSVRFHPFLPFDEWVKKQPWTPKELRKKYQTEGFIIVENLIDSEENIQIYRDCYDALTTGRIDASSHRHDLGSNEDRKQKKIENVMQIMWPSDFVEGKKIENVMQIMWPGRAISWRVRI